MIKAINGIEKNSINSGKFFEARQKVMRLDSEAALEFVLNYSQPRDLVHSFSLENLYFFICSVGIDHAGPVIALASDRQWQYFLDIEVWDKDSLDYLSMTNVFILLASSDPERFAKWCFYENIHLIELYLFRNVEIIIIGEDDDISGLGDNFFTNDGVFYFNFINYNTSRKNERQFLDSRNIMLNDMLLRFASMDHVRYQNFLMEVIGVIPSESEEELFRLKNVRLQEKGFLPFHEAVGIYQVLMPEDVKKKSKKILKKDMVKYSEYPLPHFSTDMLGNENLFIKSLQGIVDASILQQLQVEFVSLCNLLISADNKKIRSYDDLKNVVNKASSFLSIGVECMIGDSVRQKKLLANDIIQTLTFDNIFRVGYGLVMNLGRKACNWYANSWFNSHGLNLGFWGEYWFGVLGGLLLVRPKIFSDSGCSTMYREFENHNEIDQIEEVLNQIIAVDNMFCNLNLDFSKYQLNNRINASNLVLTLWALYIIGLNEQDTFFRPITLEEFKLFYSDLWEERYGHRKIKDVKKANFLIWIANKMESTPDHIPHNLNIFFENIFQKLEYELCEVYTRDIDPRYIGSFILDI